MNILMICLGNICRSPLAEGILRNKCQIRRLDVTVDSAGTSNWHSGEQADSRSIEVASTHGIDISQHRARELQSSDFDFFDHLLVMDQENLGNALRKCPASAYRDKVQMISQFASGKIIDIPDPYYYTENGFESVFLLLDKMCDQIVDKIAAKRF